MADGNAALKFEYAYLVVNNVVIAFVNALVIRGMNQLFSPIALVRNIGGLIAAEFALVFVNRLGFIHAIRMFTVGAVVCASFGSIFLCKVSQRAEG